MSKRAIILLVGALALSVLAAGCGGGGRALPSQPGLPAIGDDPANAPVGAAAGVNVFGLARRDIRFVMVTHGQASDPFWSVVQRGAQAAARQLGVSVTYQAPDTYDMNRMRQLITAAIASKPAGLIVSLPDPTALAPAIRAAERARIPVISINSGSDSFRSLGILLHVGQSEYQAGYEAGKRMAGRRLRRVLCVIHEAGNAALAQRCRGFGAAIARAGGRISELIVNLQQPQAAEQRMAAALATHRYDGLLTLGGASIAGPALDALRADHLLRKLTYATFGIGPQVLRAVGSGEITFAVDQQPYLQGYLPIVLLTQYHLYGVLPDRGKVVNTGPVFITRENARHVLGLVGEGVR